MSTSTDEEMFKSVESELKFLMDEASVPRDIQKLVYSKGFTSVRIFAGIEESKGEVRKMLASLLPLDYAASAENCKHMALLLSTWDAARLQLSIHEKNKAESKLGVQARLVQSTEQASMTAAGELPSKSLLAAKLEQVEENAPYPEDLRDVTSVEDAATEAYDAIIDPASSVLKIKPGRTMTTPPKTPEELRRRDRRIGLAWEMVRSKHMNRSWLPERCTDAFRKLSGHVLGPRLADLRAGDGRAPAWSLVLQYEAELRKQAYKCVRDGEAADLASALAMACKAPDIMNNFFIVPFTMQAYAPPLEVEAVVSNSAGGGKGKGKGAGKNGILKSISKKGQSNRKNVCFAYNRKKGMRQVGLPYMRAFASVAANNTHITSAPKCGVRMSDYQLMRCPCVLPLQAAIKLVRALRGRTPCACRESWDPWAKEALEILSREDVATWRPASAPSPRVRR